MSTLVHRANRALAKTSEGRCEFCGGIFKRNRGGFAKHQQRCKEQHRHQMELQQRHENQLARLSVIQKAVSSLITLVNNDPDPVCDKCAG
jgi:hypothetical protein